jgi:hypothetical protein
VKDSGFKIRNIVQLYEILPVEERIIVDVLRQVIADNLPEYCKERISFSVPYFYGKKGICIVWPSTVPRGGIKKGVLLGFWYGNKIKDEDHFLTHGSNKQIFYKIYFSADEIKTKPLIKLLKRAAELDAEWR